VHDLLLPHLLRGAFELVEKAYREGWARRHSRLRFSAGSNRLEPNGYHRARSCLAPAQFVRMRARCRPGKSHHVDHAASRSSASGAKRAVDRPARRGDGPCAPSPVAPANPTTGHCPRRERRGTPRRSRSARSCSPPAGPRAATRGCPCSCRHHAGTAWQGADVVRASHALMLRIT